ncbi:MAG: hypothetical protein ACKODX_06265 [Gemmata sp.]
MARRSKARFGPGPVATALTTAGRFLWKARLAALATAALAAVPAVATADELRTFSAP